MMLPKSIISLVESYWNEAKPTAEAILKQSDYYIANPTAQTPWTQDFARKAQVAYYLPLNYIRSQRVFEQIKNNPLWKAENFFAGVENYWEIGSGLSPTHLALLEIFSDLAFKSFNFVESSQVARDLHRDLLQNYLHQKKLTTHLNNYFWHEKIDAKKNNKHDFSKDLIVCSYSLTEFAKMPDWLFEAKALIIIEPATRDDGRRLLQLRNELFKNDFQIWAPCLHQEQCPLLQDSKTDWCHDRVHFEKPEPFQKIENYLPIKNETLTLSYLIAKKQSVPNRTAAKSDCTGEKSLARVTGDFLDEKGKSRQMICRNSHREFLAQLKRSNEPVVFQRGDIICLPDTLKVTGNEIRVTKGDSFVKYPIQSQQTKKYHQ